MNRAFFRGLMGAAFVVSAGYAQTQGVALVGARIEPVDGVAIATGVVGMKDGLITYVGAGPAPDGYKVIDVKGAWITPGFIDSAMTRGLKLPEPIANDARDDSTTVPTSLRPMNRKGVRPDLKAADCLDLKSSLEGAYAAGFTSGLLIPGSGTFRGQSALVMLDEGDAKAVSIRPTYGQGIAFTPGVGAGFPSTSFGVIALYRQTMFDAQRYTLLPIKDRPKELEPLGSLASILRGEEPMLWFADSGKEIVRAISLAGEFDGKLVLVGAREAYEQIDDLLAKKIPVIASVAIGSEPQQSADPDSQLPTPYLEQRKSEWREKALNLVRLSQAGAAFVLSSYGDTTNNFMNNLRSVIKLGLPKSTALRALTQGPAEMIGVGDQIGSIKVGKRACLSVFSGDPFEDKTVVTHVVVAGKVVEVKN